MTGLLLLAGGCRSTAVAGTSSAEAAGPSQPIEEGVVRIAPESRSSLDIQPAGAGAAVAVVRAPGRVAFRDGAVAQVAAPIVGRVAEIHVKVGDPVKAGDPLVTLHSPAAAAARADLESALVSLKAARAVLERQTAMLQKGVGIESEKFQAEIDVAKVESDVARAQRAVAYLGQGAGSTVVVRAPIAGTVLQRRTTLGAVADPNGEALIELGDSQATWIVADVFERDLPLVAPGAGASVALASVPQPVRGRVVSVGATLTSGMRTAPVYVALDDDAAVAPRAGMYARVTIDAQALDGVTLPVNAVLIKDGKTSVVYVQRDELTFVRREVSVGQPIDGRVHVLSGVAPGDRVVVRGALLLDGAADQLL
ncbi:efflux RND transporter periplasmic adaptor subunit [Sorangium sp. So ce1024]|uniref:efflux RND transporter periplasmic adaptor subunit n=1 Tax=Sorangium sp. So ce1024 TaxID=3133327 RepID=UPI003F02DF21